MGWQVRGILYTIKRVTYFIAYPSDSERGVGYTIYCDASIEGLGCVLIYLERVVAYA